MKIKKENLKSVQLYGPERNSTVSLCPSFPNFITLLPSSALKQTH